MDLMDTKLPVGTKNKKKKKPTLRFELDLPDSTKDSCPEYSYVELVRETLKEKKSKGENDIMCQDLLEEEEEKERNEAEALAQYYEIKYGSTAVAGQKRKRKDRIRDLVDAGYGYDENDPFVDDTEAYDEIVPASLTTQHGGFYINTGKLNFREVSDQSDFGNTSSDDSMPLSHHATKKKKLKLKNSSVLDTDESEDEFRKENREEKKKKKKKLKQQKDHEHKKKRKISLTGKDKVNLNQSAKKIKKSSTSYAQKLVAKAKAQQMMNASSLGSPAHSNGTVTPHRKSSSEEHNNAKSRMKEMGGLEGILDKELAQVAKQATKKLMNVGTIHQVSNLDGNIKGNGADLPSADTPKNTSSSADNLELPPDLPQLLGDKIESLKKLAKSAEGEGKQKFFSPGVNQILLGIEEGSQNLRTKVRNGMYQHIANHLPCSKDTLMKRVKKLQVDDCDQQLKGPIDKLREAVDAVMTMQIQNYLAECALHSRSDSKTSDKAAASTDEDDECEDRTGPGQPEGGSESGGEKVKRTYAPRRKFKWDESLRKLLCDVVRVKVKMYERFKVREKQTAEEYLKAFLESVVKPLWPKPWMQTRILFKESRSAHSHLTNSNSCQKQKKVNSGKKPTSSNKDWKTVDLTQKVDAKSTSSGSLTTPPSGSSQQKTSKKQLLYENHGVLARQKLPQPNFDSPHLTKSGPENNHTGLASGGMELVASIESGGSPGANPSRNWKVQQGTKNKAKAGSATSHESAKEKQSSSSTMKPKAPVVPKQDKKKKAQEIPTTFPNDPRSINEQFYPSDWLLATSLMMGPHSQLTAGSAQHFLSTAGLPNMDNYETISKILGLKPEDVLRAGEKSPSDKFQFKIAPPSTSYDQIKAERPGNNAFHAMDRSKSKNSTNGVAYSSDKADAISRSNKPLRLPTELHLSTAVPTKEKGPSKQKGYSSLPGTPVGPSAPREGFMPMSGPKQRSDRQSPVLSGHGFMMPEFQSSKFAPQRPHAKQRTTPGEKKNTVSPDSFRLKAAAGSHESSPRLHVPSSPTFAQNFSSVFKSTLPKQSSAYSSTPPINLTHSKYVPPTSPLNRVGVPPLCTREGYPGQLSSPQSHTHLPSSTLGSHSAVSRAAMAGQHIFATNSTSLLPDMMQYTSAPRNLPQVKLVDIQEKMKMESLKQTTNYKGAQNR